MEYQAPPEVIELNRNESEDVFFKDHKLIGSNPKNIINEVTQLIKIVIKHLEQELLLEGDGTLNLLEVATHGEDVLKD